MCCSHDFLLDPVPERAGRSKLLGAAGLYGRLGSLVRNQHRHNQFFVQQARAAISVVLCQLFPSKIKDVSAFV